MARDAARKSLFYHDRDILGLYLPTLEECADEEGWVERDGEVRGCEK